MNTFTFLHQWAVGLIVLFPALLQAEKLAVRGELIHTMAGESITDGVVLIDDGKITRVAPADEVEIPDGTKTLSANVVTPGLIDARATVGLSGILNYEHDQEQLESSAPIQPELRAIDAYNGRDDLIEWVRSFGITTINTGHSPGATVSGQTMILKTDRVNISEETVLRPFAMLAGTLGNNGLVRERGKSPGTRAKARSICLAPTERSSGMMSLERSNLSSTQISLQTPSSAVRATC
ncbi:MAG: hypothetical protein AAF514_13310, partial [Verrucomicrobiota bacterium]